MRIRFVIFAAGATALCVWTAARAADRTELPRSLSSKWFTCANGARLEVLGSDSRCTFPPVLSYQALNGCGPGWTALTDYQGSQTDMCREAAGSNQVVPRGCPALHAKIVQAGQDKCEKITVRDPEPPQHAVQA